MLLQHTGIGIDRVKLSGISIESTALLSAANLWGFGRAGCSEVWAGFSRQIHVFNASYELTGSYFQTNKGLQIFGISFKRNGQQLARFQMCMTPANTCATAYEVHPPHLYRGELRTFDQYITKIMGENYGFRSFAKHGKVSCIEVYTDLLNTKPDSFLIHKPGARKSAMYQGQDAITIDPATVDYSNPEDADLVELIEQHQITKPTTIPRASGHRTTQYTCGRSSLFQAKSYDKRTQLQDTNRFNLYSTHPTRTRVELTLRKTGLSLGELPSLVNQFEKIQVYDLAKMQAIKGSEWAWFVKAAKKDGIAIAMSRYSEHTRKAFRKSLNLCQVDWYAGLLKLWGGFPKCLEVIDPDWLLTIPQPKIMPPPEKPPIHKATPEEIAETLAMFKQLSEMAQ